MIGILFTGLSDVYMKTSSSEGAGSYGRFGGEFSPPFRIAYSQTGKPQINRALELRLYSQFWHDVHVCAICYLLLLQTHDFGHNFCCHSYHNRRVEAFYRKGMFTFSLCMSALHASFSWPILPLVHWPSV